MKHEATTTMYSFKKPKSVQEVAREQLRLVNQWNQAHAVGIRVVVIGDDGKPFKTTTRGEAWLMGGHTAIINLTGISGGYRLDRVHADEPEAA